MSEKKEDPRVVEVKLGSRSYEIRIQPDLLAQAGTLLKSLLRGKRLLVMTDRNIGPKYGHALAKALQLAGFDGSACGSPAPPCSALNDLCTAPMTSEI